MRKILIIAALATALTACGSRNPNEAVEANAEVLQDLPGNYTLKSTLDGNVRYSTAVVSEIAKGEYQISRITVYGPVLYAFKLGEQASVESAELGSGAVTYQPALKKTTIRFEKGDSLCELSK